MKYLHVYYFHLDNHQRILNNYHAQQYHYLSKCDVKKGSESDNYEMTSGKHMNLTFLLIFFICCIDNIFIVLR